MVDRLRDPIEEEPGTDATGKEHRKPGRGVRGDSGVERARGVAGSPVAPPLPGYHDGSGLVGNGKRGV